MFFDNTAKVKAEAEFLNSINFLENESRKSQIECNKRNQESRLPNKLEFMDGKHLMRILEYSTNYGQYLCLNVNSKLNQTLYYTKDEILKILNNQ